MESKSTPRFTWEKLIHSIDYAHNILPYYGYLHEAAMLMLRLSLKSNQLFTSSIEILRRLTFSSNSQIKTLKFSSEFTQKAIQFIIDNKLHLYFVFKIYLHKDDDIKLFQTLFFNQLSYVDNHTFKLVSIRFTEDDSLSDYNTLINNTFIENDIFNHPLHK